MKRALITIFFVLILISSVNALVLQIEKVSSEEVMIYQLSRPATFDLKITNQGFTDNLQFYNLLGFKMSPSGTTKISTGETKDVQIKISPIGEFDQRGSYNFEYFIKSQDGSEIKENLAFKVINLEKAFEVGSGDVDPETNTIEVALYNKVNFDFGEITTKFNSAFFEFEKTFEIGPNEKKEFTVQLEKADFDELMAGFYTLNAEISVDDQEVEIEGQIKFIEKNIVETSDKDYGFFVSTRIIEKTNEGNVISKSETSVKKNIITRLFTSFSPEPDFVERKGLVVHYTWNDELKPGEVLKISIKTNWLLPFIIILLVVAVVVLAKQYTKTNLSLRKKVSFVKSKSGEFALKISVVVTSKKYIENVRIMDRFPGMSKIYERFGAEKPSRIDDKNKRIEWNFDKLEAGEVRVVSYIIYSKVGVVGKFALPITTAIYEKDGVIHETESNRTFFISEQGVGDLEEE